MPQTVVVTFYCRTGEIERIATAAAVGAVQGRAGIRMRRLPDADPAAAIDTHPEAAESLRRMQKEYVAPKEADLLAADALVVGVPGDMTPASPECASFFDLLTRLHGDGKLTGKRAAVVGEDPAREAVERALRASGLTVIAQDPSDQGDEIARAMALGRRLVSAPAPARG